MVSAKTLLFLAAGATAFVQRRDYNSCNSDIQKINGDVTNLDNSIKSYTGGFSGAIAVSNSANTLDSDIKNSNNDCKFTGTSTQATTLINYINNTLEPNIKKTITDLDGKYNTFKGDGVQCQVYSTLNTLKTDTTNLGNTLVASAPSAQKSSAQSALNKIIADIQTGVNTFAPGC